MRKATIIQTAKDTPDRLARKEDIEFRPAGKSARPAKTVDFNPHETYQTIIGFGGAFTESGGCVLQSLPAEKRGRILEGYFHPERGLGYSLCRTHINSCDFSLGNYSCDDVPDDLALEHFSIERDRRHLIPFIRAAQKTDGADFRLIASPWSPPAWMKTNGEMNHGGRLRPECREAWARFYSRYLAAYAAEGIPVWGITVQNEPAAVQVWDSCIYSAEEERDFVRDFLGPRLEQDGFGDKKIIIWDHNRDIVHERAAVVLSDHKAAGYVWGTGFHWYADNRFENLDRVHAAFPDKHLLLTEASVEGGVKLGAWDRGERYGYNILNDLCHWAEGWIDWNMLLDAQGGPNHAKNFCDAPVIVDTETGDVYYQNSYYYLGHFSKYVKPGAVRIACAASCDGLETVAFRNPDESLAVIVLNRTNSEIGFALRGDGMDADTFCPAHGIRTFLIS